MLFDSTLRKDLARSFGVTVIVILTVVLTYLLIRTLGQAAGGSVAPQDVLLLLGYTSLGYLSIIFALALFISIVACLGRMYRESEMTIWFASGVGLSRFVKPVLRMTAPVLVAVAVLQLVVWPWGNQNSEQLRERYEKRSDLSRVAPGQFQTSRDGSRVFFIDRDSKDGSVGRNVFILTEQKAQESVTTAHRGQIEFQGSDRYLTLSQGQRNEIDKDSGDKTLSRFEHYRVLMDTQVERTDNELPPKATSSLDLLRTPTPRHLGELTWRVGLALGAVNLVLLGIGLSASNPRRASNWNLLVALLSFIIYYNLINLTQTWVANERTTLPRALLSLHGSAFVMALLLLWWRDNSNRFCLARGPRHATGSASGARCPTAQPAQKDGA